MESTNVVSERSCEPDLGAPLRPRLVQERLDAGVDGLEAEEDPVHVDQPRVRHEGALLRLVAEDEARRLPLAEVPLHRRHHHHERREDVRARRLPGSGCFRALPGRLLEPARDRHEDVRVRQDLAELDLAVIVEIDTGRALRDEPGVRAVERRLEQGVEVVPRALEDPAVGQPEIERDGGLGIVGGTRPRVHDHVELRERGHARDDPLLLLVGPVGAIEGRLRGEQQPRDFRAVPAPHAPVVEVAGPRERVVAL